MKKVIEGTNAIMIIAVIAIITFAATYAWYNGYIFSNLTNTSKSGELKVNYVKGSDVVSGNIIPCLNKSNGLSTTATVSLGTGSVAAKIKLSLELVALPSVLSSNDALTYEVYTGSTLLSTGNFRGKTQGSTMDILTNYSLTTTPVTFTVYVWLNGNKSNNEAQNQRFTANLYASTTQITGANG